MIEISLMKRMHTSDGDRRLSVELSINKEEFIALFGKSGTGKTTLLRMICGLTRPDEGFIKVDGEYWYDHSSGIDLPPQRRQVGMVFQEYALFPNMTVRKNLLYALRDKASLPLIDKVLDVMDLGNFQNRYPPFLSGGQKQRVALARALVSNPSLLLLDEPLSALEPEMRIRLQDLLSEMHCQFRCTTVLVSHNSDEIGRLADRIYIIENGMVKEVQNLWEIAAAPDLITLQGKIHSIVSTGMRTKFTFFNGSDTIELSVKPGVISQEMIGEQLTIELKASDVNIVKSIKATVEK